jgi:hypothetical protein
MSWIEITTEGNGNGAIRTGVRDYGGGIPEETRERASSILSSPRKRKGWGWTDDRAFHR